MARKVDNLPVFDIGIGELHVTGKPMVLKTVLGSCVAITMFDKQSGVAGMNHIVLPGEYVDHLGQMVIFEGDDTRYGNISLKLMLDRMKRLGASSERIIANMVGGSYMWPCSERVDIPKMNVVYARKFLAEQKIRLAREVVFKKNALRVFLNTISGEVTVEEIVNVK